MGLSPYGKPTFLNELRKIIWTEKKEILKWDNDFFDLNNGALSYKNNYPIVSKMFNHKQFERFFGKTRNSIRFKNFKKSNRASDKASNRKAGIKTAIDKMAKESVQEAAKPTAIHHSTPVTAAQANDEQAAGRWTDKAGRNTMTEKEFVDMHTIHPDVLPEFDGNVAAKKTAEAIKKAPKAMAKTPNTPTSKGDQTPVKSTEAPAANTAVVGESYMDKYAKYIRGEI